MKELSDFYECSPLHLRNIHKRNNKAFVAMCVGYLQNKITVKQHETT